MPATASKSVHRGRVRRTRRILGVSSIVLLLVLVLGTARDPNFWRTRNQRGDALFHARKFADAAKVYAEPARIGVAQYRNGDFEAAAKTFARVPGANGAFNQGNAWLMHGKYNEAIASYDRALSVRPAWKEAEENKALALARKAKIEASGEKREQRQAEAYEPDKIVFDQKKADKKGQPVEISNGKMSDEELRATWLRGVQTTPGDFLRAKFAYQAAQKNKERPR